MKYKIKSFLISLEGNGVKDDTIYNSPEKIESILRDYFKTLDSDQEHFIVVGLNSRLQLKFIKKISDGGMNDARIDQKILFKNLLLGGAQAFIMAHNHPSGSIDPSEQDVTLTVKVKKNGDLLELKLIDHIILSDTGYFSFANAGLL